MGTRWPYTPQPAEGPGTSRRNRAAWSEPQLASGRTSSSPHESWPSPGRSAPDLTVMASEPRARSAPRPRVRTAREPGPASSVPPAASLRPLRSRHKTPSAEAQAGALAGKSASSFHEKMTVQSDVTPGLLDHNVSMDGPLLRSDTMNLSR